MNTRDHDFGVSGKGYLKVVLVGLSFEVLCFNNHLTVPWHKQIHVNVKPILGFLRKWRKSNYLPIMIGEEDDEGFFRAIAIWIWGEMSIGFGLDEALKAYIRAGKEMR